MTTSFKEYFKQNTQAPYSVCVLGATGVVGHELLRVLEEKKIPIKSLIAIASNKSFGKDVMLNGKFYQCTTMDRISRESSEIVQAIDIVFCCLDTPMAQENINKIRLLNQKAIIIDISSDFRMDDSVPLIVPEINSSELEKPINDLKLISGPNCIAAPVAVIAGHLEKYIPIKRLVISTYQATSGAGKAGQDELFLQTKKIYENEFTTPSVFPETIAFNCIPHIGSFEKDTFVTGEERKIMIETEKIVNKKIPISVTSVRVPVLNCHALSMNVEFDSEKAVNLEELREYLDEADGIHVYDNPEKNIYATQKNSSQTDDVFVSRLRSDESVVCGINLWAVCDNVRKGAALNAVQIAEYLIN